MIGGTKLQNNPICITNSMHILHDISSDLCDNFNLQSNEGKISYYVYCREVLLQEYPYLLMHYTREVQEYLHTPSGEGPVKITPYMRHLADVYIYLQPLDLTSTAGRWKLWEFAITDNGLPEREPVFTTAAHDYFQQELSVPHSVPGRSDVRLPLMWCLVLQDRPDVVKTHSTREGLLDWIHRHGAQELAVVSAILRLLAAPGRPCENAPSLRPERTSRKACPASCENDGYGLNVVGYGFSESGIGEDVRSAVCSCLAAGIPATMLNVPLAVSSRQNNLEYAHLAVSRPRYGASLFCLPGPELFRAQLTMPPDTFAGQYTISAPPWELPHWPKPLRHLTETVDAFWAPSSFIAAALREVTAKPVHVAPLSVRLAEKVQGGRAAFGLPEGLFLFMFVFDWLSWPQRKNPEAVLQAFAGAFSKTRDVGLIIKTMNTGPNAHALRTMLCKHRINANVFIFDTVMNPGEIASLYHCADAYVSLHRSEGFGRTIAEAMLAGLPVVVTNYSGNRDFCTDETAFLVDGKLVPVKTGEYLFPEGQQWCEADNEQAVAMLRLCHADTALAKSKAVAGHAKITEMCSPQAVGQRYGELLA